MGNSNNGSCGYSAGGTGYNRRIKRIAKVATVIVPFMIIAYVAVCVSILVVNVKEIPEALGTVLASAFGARAVAGGALGAMMIAMQKGIARGIFSNEAGLAARP